MTAFGKLLTLLNVVLSLGILIVAIASFANPVDFTNNKAKDGNPPGLFEQGREQIRLAWAKIPQAFVSLRDSEARLADLNRFLKAHEFYKVELENLQNGAQARAIQYKGPVIDLVVAKDAGEPDLPLMAPAVDRFGMPLLSVTKYSDTLKQLDADIAKETTRYAAAVKDQTEATEKRLGANGLQSRLVADEEKLGQAKEESGRIEPLVVNTKVELYLLDKRRTALQARLAELLKLDNLGAPAIGGAGRDR